jgi:aminoglycoside phosphotransferase (APT) family kinase protein
MGALPWASEHALDAATVGALVASQFPDLGRVEVSYLDEGWDSFVYEVNRRWVFRFPKRAEVEEIQSVEAALLPRLAERVPLAIPRPTRRGEPALGYPFRFLGYEKLPGTPAILLPLDAADLEACGMQLGAFLTALHAFPVAEAHSAGVKAGSMEGRFERWRTFMLERFATMAPALSPSLADRALAYLRGPMPDAVAEPACLVHYDLCDGHVLLDVPTRRVAGIIDWGDVCVGDPAMDLAGLWQWLGEPLVRTSLRTYRGVAIDDATLERAHVAAAAMAFGTLWYGIEGQRPEFVESGLRSLEHTLPG